MSGVAVNCLNDEVAIGPLLPGLSPGPCGFLGATKRVMYISGFQSTSGHVRSTHFADRLTKVVVHIKVS